MPSAIHSDSSKLPAWERPAETTHELPWAEIAVIDLSSLDEPGGKEKLAEELRDAVQTTGFFILLRRFSTFHRKKETSPSCDVILEKEITLGTERAKQFQSGEKKVMGTEVLDNVESWNFPKYIPELAHEPHHDFFERFEAEIEDFSKHEYSSKSEDHLRYMIYRPRSESQDALVDNSWSRAHTDFGSLTLLWSQNVAGLQIKTKEGEWKYVPAVDGGIICNVGDAMQFWSAGYLKSTIHRVTRPPPDQDHIHRLGLFYFVRPGNEVDIAPAPSPLLERLGLVKGTQNGEVRKKVTGLQYVRERVRDYHDHTDYEDRRGKTFKVGDLEIEDEAA
ncbi:putative UPF0676 protein [Glarea lozoyensis 74030]|uniref:Putative UPF0676 protein n=1 Tax=Glarea lozoyensis (strain ATCC 74030 / MF5533) TaxID=1104152 RepID=H0EGM5_GLAL7|nr:putative UPF0676 protein [Glarea lozoyensis 74030]